MSAAPEPRKEIYKFTQYMQVWLPRQYSIDVPDLRIAPVCDAKTSVRIGHHISGERWSQLNVSVLRAENNPEKLGTNFGTDALTKKVEATIVTILLYWVVLRQKRELVVQPAACFETQTCEADCQGISWASASKGLYILFDQGYLR